MIRNYIKVALRGIRKNKLYTLTNLIGLSSAMMGFIIVMLYVNYELSYDKFHDGVKDIYVLRMKFSKEMGGFYNNMVPAVMAAEMAQQLPEVAHATATSTGLGSIKVITETGEEVSEKYYQFQPSFFNIFSFEALHGDLSTALDRPEGLIISRKTALKYFNEVDVVGRSLELNRGKFQITAVLDDFPANSQFQPHIIVPLATTNSPNQLSSWGMNSYFVYVKLNEGVSHAAVADKVGTLYSSNAPEGSFYTSEAQLFPFQESYWEWSASGASMNNRTKSLGADKNVIGVCVVLALVLLLTALANYVNMATSRAIQRAKEVGVRKVNGATPGQLRVQQLTETVIFCLISLVLALVGAELLLPGVSALMGMDLALSFLAPGQLLLLLSYAIVCGLLAGVYPAFFMARLQPHTVFSLRAAGIKSNKSLFKWLLGSQFALCAFLVMVMIVMNSQVRYYLKYDLGFNKEGVVSVRLPAQSSALTQQLQDKLEALPGVKGLTYAPLPAGAAGFTTLRYEDKKQKYVSNFSTDESFVETMDIRLIAGSNINPDLPSHFENGILVNQNLVKALGIENPVGAFVQMEGFNREETTKQIIGVIENLHLQGPSMRVKPLFITPSKEKGTARQRLLVRMEKDKTGPVLRQVTNAYASVFDSNQMDYEFLDDAYAKNYYRIERLTTVISGATSLIILISLFGLLSMIAFSITLRTREIGIRKVFGVTFFSLQWTLSRGFVSIITVALIIAVPLAYWLMSNVLSGFYNGLQLGWGETMLTVVAVYAMAFFAVLVKGISTLKMSPIHILRNL